MKSTLVWFSTLVILILIVTRTIVPLPALSKIQFCSNFLFCLFKDPSSQRIGNLTDESEGERSVPQISSKIARSVRALGYVELDYVC